MIANEANASGLTQSDTKCSPTRNRDSTLNDEHALDMINDDPENGTTEKVSSSTAIQDDDIDVVHGDEVAQSPNSTKPEETTPESKRQRLHTYWTRLAKFVVQYHLPLMLILAVIIGVAWPLPGKTLGDARLGTGLCLVFRNQTAGDRNICVWSTISSLCVTMIFFISGVQLKLAKMRQAMTSPKEIFLGLFLVFLLTSCFSFAVAAGPKLTPIEFSYGLALFCLMPTTLSSCVVIVGYAKGNVALALLLSVVTNLLGIAILPLTVSWMTDVFYSGRKTTGTRVDAVDLCLSLVFTVLIPLILGIALRQLSPQRIGGAADRHGLVLKLLSALFLAMVPWMKVSQSAQTFGGIAAGDYFIVILCGVGLHFLFLALSWITVMYVVKVKGLEEEKCLVIVASQKTLPVALSVLELLPIAVTGEPGLVAIPIILTQLFQTIFDSFLAVKWSQKKN